MQLWIPNQKLQNSKFTVQKVLGGEGVPEILETKYKKYYISDS
ncbi:hypothetical protein [Mastigocoleus testarum]|nr:hypothetical protein [Mastigocoleus testarum]